MFLASDICRPDVCHFQHLSLATFVTSDICASDICRLRCLSLPTFIASDICRSYVCHSVNCRCIIQMILSPRSYQVAPHLGIFLNPNTDHYTFIMNYTLVNIIMGQHHQIVFSFYTISIKTRSKLINQL